MGARVWWLLSTNWNYEAIPEVYHCLNVKTRRTLCGMKLPESYGRFTGQHDARMQVKLRCTKCNDVNETRVRTKKARVT